MRAGHERRNSDEDLVKALAPVVGSDKIVRGLLFLFVGAITGVLAMSQIRDYVRDFRVIGRFGRAMEDFSRLLDKVQGMANNNEPCAMGVHSSVLHSTNALAPSVVGKTELQAIREPKKIIITCGDSMVASLSLMRPKAGDDLIIERAAVTNPELLGLGEDFTLQTYNGSFDENMQLLGERLTIDGHRVECINTGRIELLPNKYGDFLLKCVDYGDEDIGTGTRRSDGGNVSSPVGFLSTHAN